MRLRMNANEALYEGEWFKYQYDSSTSTTSSDDSTPIVGSVANIKIGQRRKRLTLGTVQQALCESQSRLTDEIQGAINRQADDNTDAQNRLTVLEAGQNILDGQIVEFINQNSALSSDEYEGTVVKFGSDTLSLRSVYIYAQTGWVAADADAITTTFGLLGIALGSSSSTHGLLTRGVYYSTSYTFLAGRALYISSTAGVLTTTAPTASGTFTRTIGYSLGNGYLFIDPSPEFTSN